VFWIAINIIVLAAFLFNGVQLPAIKIGGPKPTLGVNACTDAKINFIFAAGRPCYDIDTKKAVIMISNTGTGLNGYRIVIEGSSSLDKTLTYESSVNTRAMTNEIMKIPYGIHENDVKISKVTITPKVISNGNAAYCMPATIQTGAPSTKNCEVLKI
jgi:hypothetical protein